MYKIPKLLSFTKIILDVENLQVNDIDCETKTSSSECLLVSSMRCIPVKFKTPFKNWATLTAQVNLQYFSTTLSGFVSYLMRDR